MKTSGSQNIINPYTEIFSEKTLQKNKINSQQDHLDLNASKISGLGDNTSDYINSNSTKQDISHRALMSGRIHSFRQKSLDLQMYQNQSPLLGLSINSERLSFQNHNVKHGYCLKHPNRKAKYYVQSQNNDIFCSKCALGSALKGQKIEIKFAQEARYLKNELKRIENFRKIETDNFMENIKLTQQILNLSADENEKAKEKIKEYYEKQLKTINEAFNHVENILVEERNKVVQKIHLSMNDSIKQMDELKIKIKLFKFEIDQQERDISNNYDNIISEMENLPFTEIMKNYNQKLNQIQFNVHTLNQSKILVKSADKINLENIQKTFEQSIIYLKNQEFDAYEKNEYEKYLNLFNQIQLRKIDHYQNNPQTNNIHQYQPLTSYIQSQQNLQQDAIKIHSNCSLRRTQRDSFDHSNQTSFLKTDQSECLSSTSLNQQSGCIQPIVRTKTPTDLKLIRDTNNSKNMDSQNKPLNPIEQQQQLQLQYKDNSKSIQKLQIKRDSIVSQNKTNSSINQSQENIEKNKKTAQMKQNDKCQSSLEKRLIKKNIPQVNIDFRVLGTNLTNSFINQK